jgi:hypothetical protein
MTDKPWEKYGGPRAKRGPWEKFAKPKTGVVDQATSGLNEGLAQFAGMPVDIATSVINGMTDRPIYKTEGDYGAFLRGEGPEPRFVEDGRTGGITAPVGGSGMMLDAIDPFISDTAPQTAGQRYARRGGQEIGFGVPAALTGAALPGATAARSAMPAYMGASLAGDIGAGVAGQTSQEVMPGNQYADIVASLLGSAAGSVTASRMTPEYGPVPTREDIGRMADERWQAVKSNPATLTPDALARLEGDVRNSLPKSQLAPNRYPNAFGAADDMKMLENPTVYDVEELRRIIGDTVAGNPQESRVGMDMKRAVSDFQGQIKPEDVTGDMGNVVDDLAAARNYSARGYRADAVLNKEQRGQTRAATTGTGGNEVNATRQNIRTLFDKERDPTLRGKAQGFTPDEMAQMERVVFGDTKQNIARLLGRLSPTSGALPMMTTGIGGASGLTAAMTTGNPLYAIPTAVAGIGAVAKSAAEGMTRKEIAKLLATIQAGGKLPPSVTRDAAKMAIIQQLLTTPAQQDQAQ